MLIRFCVENFLSFKDEVEFSMVAGESDEHPDHVQEVRDLRILKTGVVFGANASGKTNLIRAMSQAQEFITSGSFPNDQGKPTPFILDSACRAKPSEFLFEIQCGIAQCFQYHFSVDSQRVHTESLYEILPDDAKMLFRRKTNTDGRVDVEFGEINDLVINDADPLDFLASISDPRQLLLTQYKRLEVELEEQRITFLAQIYDWFDRTLVPIFADSIPSEGILLGIMKDTELRQGLRATLDFLDLGIADVGLREIDYNSEFDLTDDFKEHVHSIVKQIPRNSDALAVFGRYGSEKYLTVDADNNYSAYELVALHHVRHEDRLVAVDLAAESDGTRRLLALMPALLGMRRSQPEHVFVVDELDRSIHALLSCKVVKLFFHSGGRSPSQLIVTSHDTGLLDLDLLRRDEIWFIEKDRDGASSLYSLEEFRLPDRMDIGKGYLFGRFGAIPVTPSVESLDWIREA